MILAFFLGCLFSGGVGVILGAAIRNPPSYQAVSAFISNTQICGWGLD